MAFDSFKLTNEGRALHIKAVNGDSITFTKVAFGDGNKPEDVSHLTALVGERATASFITYDDTVAGVLNLKWQLDSSTINSGFGWREYGLFAQDSTGNEVLYAYAYDEEPVTLSKMESSTIALYIGYVTISINDTDDISVSVSDYDNVTVKQFKEHTSDTSNPHAVTAEQLGLGNVENVSVNNASPTFTEASAFSNLNSGETTSTLWGKVKKAIQTLINHLSNYSNPHKVQWSHVCASSGASLPISYGGTGANSKETARTALDAAPSSVGVLYDYSDENYIQLGTNFYNLYDVAFFIKNGIAYLNFSCSPSQHFTNNTENNNTLDNLLGIITQPNLCPLREICVPIQTSNAACEASLRISTDGKMKFFSFGFLDCDVGTHLRIQAIFPVKGG